MGSPPLCTTAQGVGSGIPTLVHHSTRRRERFPTPEHISAGQRDRFHTPMHFCTGRRHRLPSSVHHAQDGGTHSPPLCTTAHGGGTGSPPLCTTAQGEGTMSPPLCAIAHGRGIGSPPLSTSALGLGTSGRVPPGIGHDPQEWEGSARHRAPPTSSAGWAAQGGHCRVPRGRQGVGGPGRGSDTAPSLLAMRRTAPPRGVPDPLALGGGGGGGGGGCWAVRGWRHHPGAVASWQRALVPSPAALFGAFAGPQ